MVVVWCWRRKKRKGWKGTCDVCLFFSDTTWPGKEEKGGPQADGVGEVQGKKGGGEGGEDEGRRALCM